MTHAELVKLAAAWLLRNGYSVVVTEPGYVSESPDAIGWNSRRSCMVIECKASRADFLRDKMKLQHTQPRRTDALMGDRRMYLAPTKMIRPEEVPGPYGLLEPNGRGGLRTVPGTPAFAAARPKTVARLSAEMEVMRLALRRHGHGEHLALALASIRRIADIGDLGIVARLVADKRSRGKLEDLNELNEVEMGR